ncbi:MAG: NUDIX hydrolase [Verrucomicrobiota bacterium]|jgi:ADP-ribose pyrophosphatase
MNDQPILQWEGKFLRVIKCGRWEYVERVGTTGAVAIVAVTDDARLVLTEQYRIPVGQRVIELPAGLAGDVPDQATEAFAQAARRELLEETGYEAAELRPLTSGPPSAGLASEIVTFFQATGLRRVAAGGGADQEEIQVHAVPLRRVDQWLRERIQQGVLVDPKVYAGLYLAAKTPALWRGSVACGEHQRGN